MSMLVTYTWSPMISSMNALIFAIGILTSQSALLVRIQEHMLVIKITVNPHLTDVTVNSIIIFNGHKVVIRWYGCVSITV